MRTKATLAAILALPLLVVACNRADQSPTAATQQAPSQAATPASPQDKMIESSPSASGMPPSDNSMSSPSSNPPVTPATPADSSTSSPIYPPTTKDSGS